MRQVLTKPSGSIDVTFYLFKDKMPPSNQDIVEEETNSLKEHAVNGTFSSRTSSKMLHEITTKQDLGTLFHRKIIFFCLLFFWVAGLLSGMFFGGYLSLFMCKQMVTYFHLPLVTDNSWEYIVILLLILYFSYQKLFGYATEWEELRQFIRLRLVEYPYFDYNATIFEEFLEEEQDHTQPLRKDGRPFAKEQDKAMYAFHPHGVLSSGFIINGAHSCRFQASKIKWLVAENLFWLPFARDLLRWTGFSDVSKETFHQLMSESRNIALIPGGFQEATIYQKGEHRAYIKQRYGFIKMALQYGYKIYPVYTFGEEETYWTFPYFLKTRLRLNDYHIPGVLFQGVWWCFFLPFSTTKLVTIVGKPIQLPLLQEPTKEQVQKYHSLYLETLQNLFDRNKTKYAVNPNATLHLY